MKICRIMPLFQVLMCRMLLIVCIVLLHFIVDLSSLTLQHSGEFVTLYGI